MRNLLLSGGVGHPFESTSALLASACADLGFDTDVVTPEDWESALAELSGYDLLSFNALRWRMLPSRYDHLREANAYETSTALRDSVLAHIGRGGSLLALHTSCICFDDWDRWGEILGACWDWDRSFHPALADVELRAADLGTSAIPDEVYHGLRVTDSRRRVLATATVPADAVAQNEPPLGAAGIGEEQPVVWARTDGSARVLVDTLGHDRRSLTDPIHAAVLRRGLAWLAGAGE